MDADIVQAANHSGQHIEIIWCLIKNNKQVDTAVASLYRPPSGDIENFLEELYNSISTVQNITKAEIFILGDFNINQSSNDKNRSLLQTTIKNLGRKQLITDNTDNTNKAK